MPTVTLAGIVFNDGPDGDGDEYMITNVDGWDSTGVELVTVERPLATGGVVVHGRRASRSLGVTGFVIAETVADVGRARRKLAAAVDTLIDADGTFQVAESDGTYRLMVRLAAPLRTRQQGPQVVAFDLSLLAANPTKTLV